MQDGIYHVRLSSSAGGTGEGLVVVSRGSVNGGDLGFLYIGQITGGGEVLSGRLTIRRWSPSLVPVFGAIESLDLQFSGRETAPGSFSIAGEVSSQPDLTITMAGRFLSAVNSAGAG